MTATAGRLRAAAVRAWPLAALMGFILWLGPSQAGNRKWLDLGAEAMILAGAATGLNVVVGSAGLLSLGHAGFFVAGGYAGAVLGPYVLGPGSLAPAFVERNAPWFGPVFALAVGGALGVALALVCCHLRGFHLTVVTLAFGALVPAVVVLGAGLLGGLGGRTVERIPDTRNAFLARGHTLAGVYYTAAVFLLVALWLAWNLGRSRWGRALCAVRDSEVAARASGIDPYRHRVAAFAMSAAVVAVAGWVSALRTLSVSSGSVLDVQTESFRYVITVAVGGVATLAGPVLGAFLLTFGFGADVVQEHLRDKLGLVLGGLALAVVAVAPTGLVGAARRLAARRTAPPAPAVAPEPAAQRPAPAPAVAPEPAAQRPAPAPAVAPEPAAQRPAPAPAVAPEPAAQRPAPPAPAVAPEPAAQRPAPAPAVAPEPASRSAASVGEPALLSVRGLIRSFGGVTALGGLDLDVAAGSVHAVIGPNGSGKSTFVNVVTGVDRATGGSVTLAGRDVTGMPAHRRAALGMARTFQGVRVWPRMTVLDTVLAGAHVQGGAGLARSLLGMGRAEERRLHARAGELLALVRLDAMAGRRAGDLTLAEQRRLELARALAADPVLVLLDEPAAGMDMAERERLIGLVGTLRAGGLTIVVVEHHMETVLALADTVTVVHEGVKLAEGSPADVAADRRVRDAYLGPATAPGARRPLTGSSGRPPD